MDSTREAHQSDPTFEIGLHMGEGSEFRLGEGFRVVAFEIGTPGPLPARREALRRYRPAARRHVEPR